jgi:archaellum component FlaC
MDTELLNYLDEKFNRIDEKFNKIDKNFDEIKMELSEFRAENHNDIQSLYTAVGELQGNVEEMQYDTSYIAAKTLLHKKPPKFSK